MKTQWILIKSAAPFNSAQAKVSKQTHSYIKLSLLIMLFSLSGIFTRGISPCCCGVTGRMEIDCRLINQRPLNYLTSQAFNERTWWTQGKHHLQLLYHKPVTIVTVFQGLFPPLAKLHYILTPDSLRLKKKRGKDMIGRNIPLKTYMQIKEASRHLLIFMSVFCLRLIMLTHLI